MSNTVKEIAASGSRKASISFEQLLAHVAEGGEVKVCFDSRAVGKGDIFVAVRGAHVDGHDFIKQAVERGAKYVVCEQEGECPAEEVIKVADSARAGGILAQAANGYPSEQLVNLAVTGTNGKTTTGFLVQSVIRQARGACGLVGTVIYDTGKGIRESTLTTPDCMKVAQLQREMVDNGVGYMMIEASSHALCQRRLAGVEFKAAAFTNLTGDHLDYHKTQENYLAAKSILFEMLSERSIAILNRESWASEEIAKKTRAAILWYGIEGQADIRAWIESMGVEGTAFELEYAGKTVRVKTPLVGRYNVSNHLAAAGLCLAAGFDLKAIAAGFEKLINIPGRLEKVEKNGITIFIDYAHTDDALQNALSSLRPLCEGRLIVVFGCGGDRDRTKRPRMAQAAEKGADIIIVTSDNPRSEHPAAIIGEIFTGFRNPTSGNIFSEADRKKAIWLAAAMAKKHDTILIAGKGHETYQIIGATKTHFSDMEIVRECLE